MKEKPILFSGAMVRAILDGRKTMTRRVVKGRDIRVGIGTVTHRKRRADGDHWEPLPCPYGQPGDRLWVKETWADTRTECKRNPVSYRATWNADDDFDRGFNWRPSIFMPRWASRITLEITAVRVERLQEITEEDAVKEGVIPCVEPDVVEHPPGCVCNFRNLWNSINAKRGFGWDSSPWVWVVSFKRIS